MRYSKIRDVKSPEYGTPGSAGIDLFVPNDIEPFYLFPGGGCKIHSGIKVDLQPDYHLLVVDKSGIASKGLILGAKLIDSDYQGEIMFNMHNISNNTIYIEPGQKIVQIVEIFAPQDDLIEVPKDELHNKPSYRKDGGFGSTGL